MAIIAFGDFIITPMVYEGLEKMNYNDLSNVPLTDGERKIVDSEYKKQTRILEKEFEMKEKIDNWFTYHTPSVVDAKKYEAIRNAARNLANVIAENTPTSADQYAAIRKLREAVMTANASIACGGK